MCVHLKLCMISVIILYKRHLVLLHSTLQIIVMVIYYTYTLGWHVDKLEVGAKGKWCTLKDRARKNIVI